MNWNDVLKWAAGLVLFGAWVGLVVLKMTPVEPLVGFIGMTLGFLARHVVGGPTVYMPPPQPITAPTTATALPNGDTRPPLYIPGQTGSITLILAVICVVLGLLLYAVMTEAGTVLPLDPTVTQANIKQTICVSGWSKGVRPVVAFTNKVKRELIRARGLEPTKVQMALYELDHIVPLELGGAPRDRRNLQLQRWQGADGALAKDKVENTLHRRVCAGRMTLAAAQDCIYHHWQECV